MLRVAATVCSDIPRCVFSAKGIVVCGLFAGPDLGITYLFHQARSAVMVVELQISTGILKLILTKQTDYRPMLIGNNCWIPLM